jgi:hypothetical protein
VIALRLFLAAFSVASFVVVGSVSAYAQAEALPCGHAFADYADGKDYMNQEDFEQYWVDAGEGNGSNLNPEIGGSGSAFESANQSGNGKLSESEFCAWTRHNP